MKCKILPALILFICFTHKLQAQFSCGFDQAQHRLEQFDPLYKQRQAQNESRLQQIIATQAKESKFNTLSTTSAIYTIPVVVHVVHTGGAVGTLYNPSEAQINGAIDYLNKVFDGTWNGSGGPILGTGNIQIKFLLANKDPQNNPSTGITRYDGSGITNYISNGINSNNFAAERAFKDINRWDPFKYYNIWVVNKIDGKDGTSGSFIAGYAYFPPDNGTAQHRDLDGTIMLASQMIAGQKTLPHEIGHAFNLYHVFQGETVAAGQNGCPGNTSSSGDYCVDTDPVTDPTDDFEPAPFACRTGTNPCTGTLFNDNTEKNFMNYTNCYQLFTNDQKVRMQATANVTMRSSIATNWANNQSIYPTTFSSPAAPLITPSSSLLANNAAGIMSIEIGGRKMHSLNSTQEGGYINGANKWYNLVHLQPNTAYSITVVPLGVNVEQVGVYLDYNGDGSFTGTGETIGYMNNIPQGNGVIFNFTTPSVLSGNIVRLRVIEDLATGYGVAPITPTSTTLTYGQAEDYPVFLQSTVLPVNLLHFNGTLALNNIHLIWETENEINMDQYIIERAHDNNHFVQVGSVKAQNASKYTFKDASLTNGKYSYRLKMVNSDGTFTYSKTINFTINQVTSLEIINNPFTDGIHIRIPVHNGSMTFRLVDLTGRIVLNKVVQNNNDVITIQTAHLNLAKGLYVLESVIDGKLYTNKLLKN